MRINLNNKTITVAFFATHKQSCKSDHEVTARSLFTNKILEGLK